MISISMLNGVAVGLFGMLLSAAFCDIVWTRRKRLIMVGCMMALLLLQGVFYFGMDSDTVRNLYPLITHLPLVVVLYAFSKRCLWSAICVFTAYLCCQPRRWLALLMVAVLPDGMWKQDMVEFIITLPLLLLLMRFAAPAVRSISRETAYEQLQFGLIPMLAYGYDYLTQVYTNLFFKGAPVVAEFMFFVCSMAYLVFVLYTSREKQVRSQLEQTQSNLNLQIVQAVREIEHLRQSHQQTSIYRHDLRHHMQYLATSIENGQLEQAQAYIREICSDIEANKVKRFCENEAANLIFSAFAERAEVQGIPLKIQVAIPRSIRVSEIDLCVLLSNALENALHSCQKLKEKGLAGTIAVSAYEKNGRLFFQIVNSCDSDIVFEHGIPISNEPGHGIGVRSICALVERYQGLYSFQARDGQFTLRFSL